MPPSPGTTADGTPWHAGDEYRRMLAWVGDLLAARTGTAPDLAALVARGYENLPTCLPIGATMEASRETP